MYCIYKNTQLHSQFFIVYSILDSLVPKLPELVISTLLLN